jgi:uncharacterized membrane protein YbhN (UPF0104 family)
MTARRLAAWAGVLVSGVFVWLAVRDVDFGLVARALREAEWWPLVPALAALAVATLLRAVRWQALFHGETRPPLPAVTRAMLVGLLFNSILPARAGEAARIVAHYRETGTTRASRSRRRSQSASTTSSRCSCCSSSRRRSCRTSPGSARRRWRRAPSPR